MAGSELQRARQLADRALAALNGAPAFRSLDSHAQSALAGDLGRIRSALDSAAEGAGEDPYAFGLETPNDLFSGRRSTSTPQPVPQAGAAPAPAPAPKEPATKTIAERAGALTDEIDFPAFVASLIHGTFDAIVDASIRQMEAFASLVSAVAKDVERFTADNISPGQVRDRLAADHPGDVVLERPQDGGEMRLRARPGADDEPRTPAWLADYGLAGRELTDDLLEDEVLPVARRHVGEDRLQMLATLVLLGMNRVNVKDGTLSARVRFRAAASDQAGITYGAGQEPGGTAGWGARGSATYAGATTMVSTIAVNAQSDQRVDAELFGQVQINFVSETLPLDRLVSAGHLAILQRNAATAQPPAPATAAPAAQLPAPPPSIPAPAQGTPPPTPPAA